MPAQRLDEGGFTTGCEYNLGVPINYANWELRYYLPRVPAAGITAPPNPMLDPDET